MRIAVVGGTGRLGLGLAVRLAAAGHDVAAGSRDPARAELCVSQAEREYGVRIRPMRNADATKLAELVVLSVPFAAHRSTIEDIMPALGTAGALGPAVDRPASGAHVILLDVCVPFRDPSTAANVAATSAAEEAQGLVGERARVVSGLHTVSATLLLPPGREVLSDALICGDDRDAVRRVVELCREIGIRAFDAGALGASRVTEGLTPILVRLNKQFRARDIGIRVTV